MFSERINAIYDTRVARRKQKVEEVKPLQLPENLQNTETEPVVLVSETEGVEVTGSATAEVENISPVTTENTPGNKEYCRLFKDTVSIDRTGCLSAKLMKGKENKSGHIMLYEIVINFNGVILSVRQMLSTRKNTNSILYWLNEWLSHASTKPKEVSDYPRALLGAESLCFNVLTVKDYVAKCFTLAKNYDFSAPPVSSLLRIDVAHFIVMICRLKCLNQNVSKAVKEFLVRCVALMVSCNDFHRFEEILSLTLILTIHSYDRYCSTNTSLPTAAENARIKLLEYIIKETHSKILLPEESSEEYKNIVSKISASGYDPMENDTFTSEEIETHAYIK